MHVEPKALAEAIAPVIGAQLDRRDARIAELEGRIALLEKAITGEKVTEWPIPNRSAA